MQANDLVSRRCTSSCQKKRDHSLKSVRCFCRCVWSKIALSHYFGHWLILQFVLPYKPWFLKRLLVPAQFHSPVQFLCSSAKRAGQFFCSFVANLLQYLCAKNYRNITWFDFSFFLSPLGWHTLPSHASEGRTSWRSRRRRRVSNVHSSSPGGDPSHERMSRHYRTIFFTRRL